MTTTLGRPGGSPALPTGHSTPIDDRPVARKGNIVVQYLTTTDHKRIGYLYLTTSFVYFMIGGVLALVIRAQLFAPGLHLVPTPEIYNQLFTMHGTIMLLMFATPLFAGFTNGLRSL
jgi:cytochrome c oxidase subunit I